METIELTAMCDGAEIAPESLATRGDRLGKLGLLSSPALPAPVYNRVFGLESPDEIPTAVDHYRRRGIAKFWVHVDAERRSDLGGALERAGFVLARRPSWAIMIRDASPLAERATGPRVEEIGRGHALALGEVVRHAFGLSADVAGWIARYVGRPRWRAYAAFDEEGVVAGGGLVFVDGDRAWLGLHGTRADQRGRGVQRAVMERSIADAVAMGCRTIHGETGEPVADEPNPSLANLHRCGFVRAASRLNYEFSGTGRAP
jgi:GNAT superfamily N-acetyltransferase